MKNQIWIYAVVGAVALAVGFYAGKMAVKKKAETGTNTGTATTKKVKQGKLWPNEKGIHLRNNCNPGFRPGFCCFLFPVSF
jgi:hypothetical protein